MDKELELRLKRIEGQLYKLDEAATNILSDQKYIQELILELLSFYKKLINFETNFLKKKI